VRKTLRTRRLQRTQRCIAGHAIGSPLCPLYFCALDARDAGAQEPPAPQASPRAAPGPRSELVDLDYAARTTASRRSGRTASAQAVLRCFRLCDSRRLRSISGALLLTGSTILGRKTRCASRSSARTIAGTVAYSFFEHIRRSDGAAFPDRAPIGSRPIVGRHWYADGRACGERRCCGSDAARVRQALLREVAARELFPQRGDRGARRLQGAVRGRRARRRRKARGPLQDDAAWRWGRSATSVLWRRWRPFRGGRRADATSIATASASSGSTASRMKGTRRHAEVSRTELRLPELLRGAAAGLAALALAGHPKPPGRLVEIGVPSRDPTRAPVRWRWRPSPCAHGARDDDARAAGCSRDGGSRCSPRASICWRKISTKSGSSPLRAHLLGITRQLAAPCLMQTLIGKLDF